MQIPYGVNKKKWIEEHLFRCGTCKFYRGGICNNLKNETYGDILEPEADCSAYVPERQVENRIL